MKQLKSEDLTKLSDADLTKRLTDIRSELSKLRSGAARGTLKKELGEIKSVRRNLARVLTVENARKRARLTPETKPLKASSEQKEEEPKQRSD